MERMLEELKTVDRSSQRCRTLLQAVTANFDKFAEDGVPWGLAAYTGSTNGKEGSSSSSMQNDPSSNTDSDHFVGYTFKRKKV
jgi:hypothetical protein